MDCIRTAPETARFGFDGLQPPNGSVNQSVKNGDRIATLIFNQSYLSINSFNNVEGFCQGARAQRDPFFYLFFSQGKNIIPQYITHSTITCLLITTSSDDNALLSFYHFLTGTLSSVTIRRVVPNTTDVRIVLNDTPSDIDRIIVGYERRDLGVILQGEYKNIIRDTQHTFSSLVPGARYTVVVQGLSGTSDRSQHITRRDVKTTEKSEDNICYELLTPSVRVQ